jgi:hypothetical protein
MKKIKKIKKSKNQKKSHFGFVNIKSILDIYKCPIYRNGFRNPKKLEKSDFPWRWSRF